MPDTKPMSEAAEILSEAMHTIESTFWVIGKQFDWHYDIDTEQLNKLNAIPLESYGQVHAEDTILHMPKFIPATTPAGSVGAIAGVCSIGAIALAYHSKNGMWGKALQEFEQLASFNLPTSLAGQALAEAIILNKSEGHAPDYTITSADTSHGDLIATWNDNLVNGDRGRAEVLRLWKEAMKRPCLDWKEQWYLTANNAYVDIAQAVAFESKDECERFLRQIRTLDTRNASDDDVWEHFSSWPEIYRRWAIMLFHDYTRAIRDVFEPVWSSATAAAHRRAPRPLG